MPLKTITTLPHELFERCSLEYRGKTSLILFKDKPSHARIHMFTKNEDCIGIFRGKDEMVPYNLSLQKKKKEDFFCFLLFEEGERVVFSFSQTTTPITSLATPPLVFSVECGFKKKRKVSIPYCTQYSQLDAVSTRSHKAVMEILKEINIIFYCLFFNEFSKDAIFKK